VHLGRFAEGVDQSMVLAGVSKRSFDLPTWSSLVLIVDCVYEEIRQHLGRWAPERGGALYGLRGHPCITHFEYDEAGETTAGSYVPSVRLVASVQRVEAETGLEFKGIIHSHPRGFVRPSGQDERAVAKFFELNPHFSHMALPIVQEVSDDDGHPEVPFLYWYRAERARSRPNPVASVWQTRGTVSEQLGVHVTQEDFHVLQVHGHARLIGMNLGEVGGEASEPVLSSKVQHIQLMGADLVGLVCSTGGREFMFFVSLGYPVASPLVLYEVDGSTRSLQVAWDGTADPIDQLGQIARSLMSAWPNQDVPYQVPSAFAGGSSEH
jgi:hypothetical protein